MYINVEFADHIAFVQGPKMEIGYPHVHLYFAVFNRHGDAFSFHFRHLLSHTVPQIWRSNTLHEAVCRIEEERQSWQKHQYLQLKDEDILDEAKVDAEEVAPKLA